MADWYYFVYIDQFRGGKGSMKVLVDGSGFEMSVKIMTSRTAIVKVMKQPTWAMAYHDIVRIGFGCCWLGRRDPKQDDQFH